MVELIHTHKGTVYAQRNGVLIPVNTDGLVGYWPMTQGSGLTAYDESKNGNDGTLNNGPVWTNTANGKALDFDGVDDYVEVPDNSSLKIPDNLTLSVWIKTDSFLGNYQDILFKGTWANYGYSILKNSNDDNRVRPSIRNGTSQTWNLFSAPLSTDQWHNIIVTYSDPDVKIYTDGNFSDSDTVSGPIAYSDSPLHFAKAHIDEYWDGQIDEVRIYNRALSAQEITNMYEKTRGLYNV